MTIANGYQHLECRPGSNYKQLFVKGRRIRAEILYRQTIGNDSRTPQQVAADYELPLETVQEAIQYCIENPQVLQEDRDREQANVIEDEQKQPPIVPVNFQPAP
jgi:uncharacterized protein (DUF433 family)